MKTDESTQEKLKIEVNITYKDYKNIKKKFNSKFWKTLIGWSIPIVLFFLIDLFPPDPSPLIEIIELDIFIILFIYIGLKLNDLLFRKHNYKKLVKNVSEDINYTLNFKDEYLEKESEYILEKIPYKNIKTIQDTVHNIYIQLKNEKVLLVKKRDCSDELLEKIVNLIRTVNKTKKFNNAKEYLKEEKTTNKIVDTILIIFFVLTILCLWLAPSIVAISILLFANDKPSFLAMENWCFALIVLPIPIISIILGIIYNSKGFKGTKNIIAGGIIAPIIFLIGTISFSINFETNYKEINSYKKIIGVEIPSTGEFYKVKWDSSYLKEHTTNYALFEEESAKDFYKAIKQSENWQTASEVSTDLNQFLTATTCESEDTVCYYSVYIDELNVYNTTPTETGTYKIYSMMYDPTKEYLEIDEYTYDYKK